jgi:acetyltransferase
VTPDRVVALDASIQVDACLPPQADRPFAHLAIRPYPEEYVQSRTLKDGTEVIFRPVKPEDEPRWQRLMAECSDESIRLRFRALFQRSSHEVATRYCFLDYDREMSILAEVEQHGQADMIGVGNLFSDSNRESAEFAVLVADRWQGHGLGAMLTDSCMQVARTWGLRTVHAETGDHNTRMISLFTKNGFALDRCFDDRVVLASKTL